MGCTHQNDNVIRLLPIIGLLARGDEDLVAALQGCPWKTLEKAYDLQREYGLSKECIWQLGGSTNHSEFNLAEFIRNVETKTDELRSRE